jgi:hypothetical protein
MSRIFTNQSQELQDTMREAVGLLDDTKELVEVVRNQGDSTSDSDEREFESQPYASLRQ